FQVIHKMTKRPDLQGIRGLAIAAVIAFHLDGTAFPSGFIGVDIFFVLSGYLMAVILSREPELNAKVFRNFYMRRFKRIVPLYALLIVALAFIVPIFMFRPDVIKYCQDVIWAATFSTNIHSILEKTDYFHQLSTSGVLTHTWSLGVEIQYYFIVPLIVLAHRKLSETFRFSPLLVMLFIASLVYHLIASPKLAFNSLTARVWQFIAGGLAHEVSTSLQVFSWPKFKRSIKSIFKISPGLADQYVEIISDEKGTTDEDVEINDGPRTCKFWPIGTVASYLYGRGVADILSIILLVLVICPSIILPVSVYRVVAVLTTGVLLVLGDDECCQGFILSMRFLVYLGDISYALYLVHWPMIAIWKDYHDSIPLSLTGTVVCLGVSLVVSACIHHAIEQYFIRSKAVSVSALVGVLYITLVVSLHLDVPLKMNKSLQTAFRPELASAIEWNERESHNDYHKHRPFEECLDDLEVSHMSRGYVTSKEHFACVWKPRNSTGRIEILVLGNSISFIAIRILHSIIERNFPQIGLLRLFPNPSCAIIMPYTGYNCTDYLNSIPVLVNNMRPDITFTIFHDDPLLREPLLNASTDAAAAGFIKFLQPISKGSRVLVLDEFYPSAYQQRQESVALTLHKRLIRNKPLDDLKMTYEFFSKRQSSYFARLDLLPFPNLIRHNISAAMCSEETGLCWWYNRRNMHSYFTDQVHFTDDGLELLRESYTQILRKAIGQIV
ncbi:hypothetical protein PRIPAC_80388, partial [Pristionchus pacificus]